MHVSPSRLLSWNDRMLINYSRAHNPIVAQELSEVEEQKENEDDQDDDDKQFHLSSPLVIMSFNSIYMCLGCWCFSILLLLLLSLPQLMLRVKSKEKSLHFISHLRKDIIIMSYLLKLISWAVFSRRATPSLAQHCHSHCEAPVSHSTYWL